MGKNKIKTYVINLIGILFLFLVFKGLLSSGVLNSYYEGIFIQIGFIIIFAISVNIVSGFMGQLVLGQAGFMAIGAYSAAIVTLHSTGNGIGQLVISLLVGGVIAGFAGFLIGIPALRLRGDYLGIITLGFGEVIRVMILNLDITGHGKQLNGIPYLVSFNVVFSITVLVVVLTFTLMMSRHGRAILSIRENEIAAEAVGIPTSYYKIFAFTVAAFLAGIAGGLEAHYVGILQASDYGFLRSVDIVMTVVFGGLGSITGSIISVSFIQILQANLSKYEQYRMVIFPLVLIIMMLVRPEGLLGRKEFSLTRFLENLPTYPQRIAQWFKKGSKGESL